MNGYVMYEVARQRVADRHRDADAERAARQVSAARGRRGRHARAGEPDGAVLPAVPDFVHELLGGAVPAPRPEDTSGRHTRTGR
ncbi:MAG TPA: hypothetical protein VGD91_31085 [Trebonia sp.]